VGGGDQLGFPRAVSRHSGVVDGGATWFGGNVLGARVLEGCRASGCLGPISECDSHSHVLPSGANSSFPGTGRRSSDQSSGLVRGW